MYLLQSLFKSEKSGGGGKSLCQRATSSGCDWHGRIVLRANVTCCPTEPHNVPHSRTRDIRTPGNTWLLHLTNWAYHDIMKFLVSDISMNAWSPTIPFRRVFSQERVGCLKQFWSLDTCSEEECSVRAREILMWISDPRPLCNPVKGAEKGWDTPGDMVDA